MNEVNSNWKNLYKLSGCATGIFILYSLVTMVVMFGLGTPPTTASDVFQMLEENKLIGLLRLDILTLFAIPLYYVIFLGIYVPLRKTDLSYTTLGTLATFAGVTLLLATPSVFSLLSLSDQFASATTDVQRSQLLAAGEAVLVSDMWHGSGAIIGGLLSLVGALILSIVMLKSEGFAKATAYVGILTYGLDLLRSLIGFFAPQVSMVLMAIAGTLYLVWFPLLTRDFFKLSRSHLSE